MPELALILLALAVLASLGTTIRATILHDPISAAISLFAGPEIFGAVAAPEIIAATAAPEIAAGVGAGAGAGILGAADAAITLPELAVTAAAPAAAGVGASVAPELALGIGAGAGVAGLAEGAGAAPGLEGTSTAADLAGPAAGALDALSGVSPGFAGNLTSTAGGALAPGASTLSVPTAPSLASVPAQITSSPDIIASVTDPLAGSGAAPTASGAPVAGGPGAGVGTGSPSYFDLPAADMAKASAGSFPSDSTNSIIGSMSTAKDAGSSGSGLLSKIGLGNVGSFFKDNKDLLGILGAAAPLVMRLFNPDPLSQIKNLTTANSLATTQAKTGEALTTGALSGVLPAGFENALDRSKVAADAKTVSGYGNLGVSGSTAEAADLAANNAQIEGQRAVLLQDLMKRGIDATGMAAGTNIELAKIALAQDEETQQAIQRLASSLMLSTVHS